MLNIANPCRMFLMVGALAAGFAVRADGTLPIPVTNNELPFLMNGQALEKSTTGMGTTTRALDINMTLDTADNPSAAISPKLKARCRNNEKFYAASGSVQVAENLFDIQGICAPGSATGPRQIIATSTGRILQFDGNFAVNAARKKSFIGNLLTIDSVTTTPETGDSVTKTITFELYQVGAGE